MNVPETAMKRNIEALIALLVLLVLPASHALGQTAANWGMILRTRISV